MDIQQMFFSGMSLYLLVLLSSCGVDETTPHIGISTPDLTGATYEVEDTLRIIGTAADDEELASIEFSSNLWSDLDSCLIETPNGTLFWGFDKSLIIDSSAPEGQYTLTITAKDKSQNAMNLDVAFDIITDLDPMITIETPMLGSTVLRGDTLLIVGQASDDIALSSIRFTIDSLSFDERISSFDPATLDSFIVPVAIADTVSINQYELKAVVTDDRGQSTETDIQFNIE